MNPGLGELADRYSILKLKQLRSSTPVHFEDEADQILEHVISCLATATFNSDVGMHMVTRAIELAAVNGVIWEATDSIAESMLDDDKERIIGAAKTLYYKNRRRGELIHFLNELEAGKRVPKEKV